jgi:hypothetical protein
MNAGSSKRVSGSTSDNRKSKIQNRQWVGILAVVAAIALTLVFGGAVARAQQPGKIFRIGFLDPSTASNTAGLLEPFRQELNRLGWIEGKNLTSSIGLVTIKAVSTCLSLQRSWFVSRLI